MLGVTVLTSSDAGTLAEIGCETNVARQVERLAGLGVAYLIRVPLVPGVTDTDVNLRAIARHARELREPAAGATRDQFGGDEGVVQED